jgi:Ca2+-binding EF-hand superfamily protein
MKKFNQILKKKNLGLKNNKNFRKLKLNREIGLLIIQGLFEMYDENSNKNLDEFELRKVLNGLGYYLNDEEILELMKDIDKDGSGNIDIQEFIEVFGKTHLDSNYFIEQYIDRAFELYDKDSDGFISENDLKLTGEELTDDFEENELSILFNITKLLSETKKIENPEKHLISKEEFVNLLIEIGFIEEIIHDNTGKNSLK